MFDFLYSKLRVVNSLGKLLDQKSYEKVSVNLLDNITGEKYTIVDLIVDLNERIKVLEEKYNGALLDIKRLEGENIELTNSLYEIENTLQAQIDNIHPVVYNLQDYTVKENNENFS